MKKLVITTDKSIQAGRNQEILVMNLPFYLYIATDKNNQIHEVIPREFGGEDIFSQFHGRPSEDCGILINKIKEIYEEQN